MPDDKKFQEYNILKSFVYAFKGLIDAFRTEMNVKIQLIIGLVLILLNFFLNSTMFVLIHFIFMMIVISQEILNTSVEFICDMITMEYNPKVKRIKDLAAGSVLVLSIAWAILIILNIFMLWLSY
jgi:diacylglycerol kinase